MTSIFDGKILAIYGPMIYTATYVMVLIQTDSLRELVGERWALEIETFLGSSAARKIY